MKRILYIALLLLSFLQVEGKGQTYPVSAFVNLTPPYSSYLPDYADPFNNQLRVLLTLNDFSIPSYTVKLRFRLEGSGYTIVNDNLLALPAFTLTPGVPIEISGNDLAPYLSSSNLSFTGIDVADYELRKVLPEGPCSICVEVVDFSNPNQAILGNPACVQAWFSLNDPPLLNMPFCGQEIPETDPQNIVFSWTPMSMGSPYGVSTEYTFELFELRPEGADPNMTVTSTLPIYTTTTTNTLLNYGIIEPPLQLGMQYIWRVRAREIDGRDIYRNNGYSAVCTFTYGNIAASLADGITLELNAEGIGPRIGKAFWNTAAVFDGYRLEVRKTGNPDYAWFPYESASGMITVNSLEPETEYEARVQGLIGEDFESEWSNIATFTTYPPPNYACGSTALPGKQETIIPLTNLMVGNFVSFGQFDMQLTQVDPLGTPGHYKGYGKILVPFALTNFPVRFDDILVDENFMVREGRADALTDGLAEYINWLDREFINGIIDDIAVDTVAGTVTVTFGDETKTFTFPENGGPLVLEDESGLIFIINPDGTITYDGEITIDPDVLAAAADYQIRFEASTEQVYGFDKLEHIEWRKNYGTIVLGDGSFYHVPYKSIATEETDKVLAVFRTSGNQSGINFKTGSGASVSYSTVNDSTYLLDIPAYSNDGIVYGYDGSEKIGKLNVKVYEEEKKVIYLVSINGATIPDNLEISLNETYAQAVIHFDIPDQFSLESNSWDINEDGKLESPSELGLLNKYSEEMNLLTEQFFAYNYKDPEAIYLFIIPEFEDAETSGYMPRGKNIGFVKSSANVKTIPHELGHGCFAFKHTFPEVEKSTTNNLMDYSEGYYLTKFQWDWSRQIHLNLFDLQAENQLITESDILSFYEGKITYKPANPEIAYPLMDGTPMRINNVTAVAFDIYGRVARFIVNDTIYKPLFLHASFSGYNFYIGYFTESVSKSIRDSIDFWDEAAFNICKGKRFNDFLSPEKDCEVYTESKELIWETYVDCYGEYEFALLERISSTEYMNLNWRNLGTPRDFGLYLRKSVIGGTQCANYGSFTIYPGPYANLFIQLLPFAGETMQEGEALAEMVNFLNEQAKDKISYFYTEFDEVIYTGQKYFHSTAGIEKVENRANDETVIFFKTFEIFNLERFVDFFPVICDGDKKVDLVFSTVNLWEFLETTPNYNALSIDYTSFPIPHIKNWYPLDEKPVFEVVDFIDSLYSFQIAENPDLVGMELYDRIPYWISEVRNHPFDWLERKMLLRKNIIVCFHLLGLFELYEYNLLDLIERRKVERFDQTGWFIKAIIENEEQGTATSIYQGNTYDQYIAQFDNDCAFFFGLKYLKMYVESTFEPALIFTALSKMHQAVKSFKGFKTRKNIDALLRVGSVSGKGNAVSKLDNILAKPGFNGPNGLFNKLKSLPQTTRRTTQYANLQTFRDEFLRLHGLNNSGVKNIDDVLNDLENLVDNFSGVPNVEKYVDEIMQSANKFKGGAYGLEILNNLPPKLQGKTLTKFEASIDDLDDFAEGCRFDLQFADGSQMIYIETKNYAQSTVFSKSFYNQFKAYIGNGNVTDINQIKYYFRANTGVTKADRVQKFKNMLLNGNKYEEIYNSNKNLFNSMQITDEGKLKLLLESQNTTHHFFNFIEIF